MMTRTRCFNFYLLLLLCLVLAGCRSPGKRKFYSTVRLHLEVPADATGQSAPVPIYRANPIQVNVHKQPFLDERSVVRAKVFDVMGSFAIQIEFDRHGELLLENVTTGHRGRRVAVFSRFLEDRWLAAPILTQRITNGVFAFTPDATREEAEKLVEGLNNVAARLKTHKTGP